MTAWSAIASFWNPTRAWREDDSRSLVLDLDTHRLSGVGIGEPAPALSFLGPASRWSCELEFPNHGLAVLVSETIEELHFYFGHRQEPAGGRFGGEIRYRGAPIALQSSSREQDVLTLFGEPFWRDADCDETILFYEYPQREWQLELGADGGLKCFIIGRPILADSAQRQAYGVTKPWPAR